MSFDFEKIKDHEEGGHNWWTAYSDLFLMLSTVFLLLYVVSSLKTGSTSVLQQVENQRLSKKNEELEQQVKVYTTLKEDYMENRASDDEQKVYTELMDKLSLLQDQARDEKEQLRIKARDNEKKEFALNKYQQIIRNIIDTNMLAKDQINRRDKLITKKDTVIVEKTGEINNLSKEIAEKQRTIAENESKIARINTDLESKVNALKAEQVKRHMTKAQLDQQIARLKQESQQRVDALESKNQEVAMELNQVRGNLTQTKTQLAQTEGKLNDASTTIDRQEREKGALVGQLEQTKAGFQAEINNLRAAHNQALAAERGAFERDLKKQQLSAQARAAKLAAFQAQAEAKARDLEGKVGVLNGKIKQTEGELAEAEKAKGRFVASINDLKKEKADLSDDLARTREIANARKNLANRIKDNFKQAGIKADVDEKTGEVTLAFGDEYFETGSSKLNPKMEQTLNRFIPIYAGSLFKDPKTAEKIANVEIVGFASSTFKGKYVNPTSLAPKDQEAINYNLKLSFGRANAIFKHIFNPEKLSYEHQKDLLPMVKVVGRGFLPEGVEAKSLPSEISEEQFCKKFNCKKAQRVVVKFNLKD